MGHPFPRPASQPPGPIPNQVGLNLSVAAGPVGRQIEGTGVAGGKGKAACYAYAVSRGAFAGVALDGTVLFTRDRLNHTFYGRAPRPPPPAARTPSAAHPPRRGAVRRGCRAPRLPC